MNCYVCWVLTAFEYLRKESKHNNKAKIHTIVRTWREQIHQAGYETKTHPFESQTFMKEQWKGRSYRLGINFQTHAIYFQINIAIISEKSARACHLKSEWKQKDLWNSFQQNLRRIDRMQDLPCSMQSGVVSNGEGISRNSFDISPATLTVWISNSTTTFIALRGIVLLRLFENPSEKR